MKGILILVALLFCVSALSAQNVTLITNDFDLSVYKLQELNDQERVSLDMAISNELNNISNYCIATNQFGETAPEIDAILDSKIYHIYLIQSMFNKYNILQSEFPYVPSKRQAKSFKEYCRIRVNEELGNKSLYEMMSYQVNNKDIQAIFQLISNNSEKSFKLMQMAATRKK